MVSRLRLTIIFAAVLLAAACTKKNDESFYDVTLGQRAAIAAAYFILVVFLGHQTYLALSRLALAK